MMKHLALQDTSLKGFFFGGVFVIKLPVTFTESNPNRGRAIKIDSDEKMSVQDPLLLTETSEAIPMP